MPTYEYHCENGHTFESFQSMHDDALDACEVCGVKAERVLSAPAVHFKGSGFYTTDYARRGAKQSAGDGGSDSKDSKDSKEPAGSKGSAGSGSSEGSAKSDKASSSSSGSGDSSE